MSDFRGKVSGFFSGLKKAAGEVVDSSEVMLAKGKTSSKTILTDSGDMIVDAGHVIDDEAIERARKAGKLGALAAAAVTSKAQDLRDRTRNAYNATPDGVERRSMASSEQYLEARLYIGYVAAVEVTDIRGNVIVPVGMKIDDEHVRAAREADQLGSLIYSAQQSPPPHAAAAPPPPEGTPITAPDNAPKRAARPLATYYEEEEGDSKDA